MITWFLLSSALGVLAWFGAQWRRSHVRRLVRQERTHERLEITRSLQRATRVRAAAESAALRVALGRQPGAANPFRVGTRDRVLWTTSYHAKLMELETEAFAPAPAVPAWSERPAA